MPLKPGDRVNCRVKDHVVVSAYKEYDEIRTFEILAPGDYGYYVYVPQYIIIRNTTLIGREQCKRLGIDPRFIGEQMGHIAESMICEVIQKLDGMQCVGCQEFVPMAEPNQENKTTFVCWSCRANPYR